ncbi:XRE family transcriptional regulator [Qipengyuania sp. 6B39]|uniref:helix-turn-helix domain-containing protein n=1 Tax=Qipengyuania proteolytica TaxID=2867239 RepID=UPI001C89928C|nr:XRE family transcriptional regulator [Qipengyuania proteolytica]
MGNLIGSERGVCWENLELARHLETLRHDHNLSLEEVAKRSGVSRATLSRIERGTTSPTAQVLGRLCAAYGLTTSQLLLNVEKIGPSIVKWAEAFCWEDPATRYRRTSVSPPQPGFQIELVYGELPAAQRIEYPHPSRHGLEQHILVLKGKLRIECQGETYAVGERDCLRFFLNGPTVFETNAEQAAQYLVALRVPT